ncbi:RNA polymerase sigma-70 factor [Parapedobacter deserti]|uniref:RNA polymerase sigma-70 factor n=1 Tax=Parapedobacter deserti TaxID=1912957 RepID=A0ABV7JHM4_9SPHI
MAQDHTSTGTLFARIQRGEKQAFDQLYLLHFDNLKQFAQQYVKREEAADELVSELFVQVWLRKGSLHEINNPTRYLYQSVKNACLTYLKRENRHARVPIDEVDQASLQTAVIANPEQLLEYKELLSLLEEAVDLMPHQRQTVFRMVKEDRLKCREVAELLGLSVRTVENQVYRAVKQLNEVVERYFDAGNANHGRASRFFFLVI